MIVKRVGPLSCAKIAGTLYAVLGIVLGAFVSIASLVGRFAGSGENVTIANFGLAAIFVLPVLYGGLGFLLSLLGAWLYNTLAGFVGGIEVEVESAERNRSVDGAPSQSGES